MKKIPIVVICYNNGWYVDNSVKQLRALAPGSRLIIIDNASTCSVTQEMLSSIEEREPTCIVIRRTTNGGHLVFNDPSVQSLLPDLYAVTDPDLQFCPDMPGRWLEVLADLTAEFRCGKVGLALDISADAVMYDSSEYIHGRSIRQWEAQFWEEDKRAASSQYPDLELYHASVDTTFAVYNKQFYRALPLVNHYTGMRVANNFTCAHLPWYPEHNRATFTRCEIQAMYSPSEGCQCTTTGRRILEDDLIQDSLPPRDPFYALVKRHRSTTATPPLASKAPFAYIRGNEAYVALKYHYQDAWLEAYGKIMTANIDPPIAFFTRAYAKALRWSGDVNPDDEQTERKHDFCFIGAVEGWAQRRWIVDFARKHFTARSLFINTSVDLSAWQVLGEFDHTFAEETPQNTYNPRTHANSQSREAQVRDPDQNRFYFSTMAQSEFCLCPAGDSPWSFRWYEVLMCGSIPVVSSRHHTYRTKLEFNVGFEYVLFNDATFKFDPTIVAHNHEVFERKHLHMTPPTEDAGNARKKK